MLHTWEPWVQSFHLMHGLQAAWEQCGAHSLNTTSKTKTNKKIFLQVSRLWSQSTVNIIGQNRFLSHKVEEGIEMLEGAVTVARGAGTELATGSPSLRQGGFDDSFHVLPRKSAFTWSWVIKTFPRASPALASWGPMPGILINQILGTTAGLSVPRSSHSWQSALGFLFLSAEPMCEHSDCPQM